MPDLKRGEKKKNFFKKVKKKEIVYAYVVVYSSVSFSMVISHSW